MADAIPNKRQTKGGRNKGSICHDKKKTTSG